MSDYIRREDAICLIKHYLDNPPKNHSQLFISGMEDAYYRMLSNLNNFHSADVVQVRHGRWLPIVSYNNTYKCSECGRLLVDITDGLKMVAKHYPYCHCGAKMDGE